jgi:hypothetical protein
LLRGRFEIGVRRAVPRARPYRYIMWHEGGALHFVPKFPLGFLQIARVTARSLPSNRRSVLTMQRFL